MKTRSPKLAIPPGPDHPPRELSRADLADPNLPVRLAMLNVIGLATRLRDLEGYGGLWYWRRGRHCWWRIPAQIEKAAGQALVQALAETAKRNGGRTVIADVVPVLLARLTAGSSA